MERPLRHQQMGARLRADWSGLGWRLVRAENAGVDPCHDCGILSSPLAILAIMLYGAAGFYLGIDLPAAPPDHRPPLPLTRNLGSRADVVELLSAAGTFLAAVAAVVSVSGIVLDDAVHTGTARLIIFAWAIGTTMQIGAGIMARTRAEASTTS